MRKLSLAAGALLTVAIFSLLSIATIPETGPGQISLGEEKLATTTPALRSLGEGGYRASDLLWLSSTDGTADVTEWEQTPICVDTGAWEIQVSGENINVSWRETPDEIVIIISGTLPNSDDIPASAHVY